MLSRMKYNELGQILNNYDASRGGYRKAFSNRHEDIASIYQFFKQLPKPEADQDRELNDDEQLELMKVLAQSKKQLAGLEKNSASDIAQSAIIQRLNIIKQINALQQLVLKKALFTKANVDLIISHQYPEHIAAVLYYLNQWDFLTQPIFTKVVTHADIHNVCEGFRYILSYGNTSLEPTETRQMIQDGFWLFSLFILPVEVSMNIANMIAVKATFKNEATVEAMLSNPKPSNFILTFIQLPLKLMNDDVRNALKPQGDLKSAVDLIMLLDKTNNLFSKNLRRMAACPNSVPQAFSKLSNLQHVVTQKDFEREIYQDILCDSRIKDLVDFSSFDQIIALCDKAQGNKEEAINAILKHDFSVVVVAEEGGAMQMRRSAHSPNVSEHGMFGLNPNSQSAGEDRKVRTEVIPLRP